MMEFLNPATMTVAEVERYLGNCAQVCKSNTRFFTISIVSPTRDTIGHGQRQLFADFVTAHKDELRSQVIRTIIVCHSRFIRALVRASAWLVVSAMPIVLVGSERDAASIVRSVYAREGRALPANVEQRLQLLSSGEGW